MIGQVLCPRRAKSEADGFGRSQSNLEALKQSIAKQEEHQRQQSFQDEQEVWY
jgi:hypothetical protein